MNTARLSLPLLAAGQSQKHVTHNDALVAIDALTQLAVVSTNLAAPPAAPDAGARYIVATAATGAWLNRSGQIAEWLDGHWHYHAPQYGWQAFDIATGEFMVFSVSGWSTTNAAAPDAAARFGRIGINTAPDLNNALAVRGPSTLLDNGGQGHRLAVNKATVNDTASLIFQSGYGGRAEMGLAGNDDFTIKVSADAATWRDAMAIDRTTGRVVMTGGMSTLGGGLLINGDFLINQRGFAGGALAAGVYGFDRWRAGTGGCTINLSSAGTVTLLGPLEQIVEVPFTALRQGLPHLAGTTLTLSLEPPEGAATLTQSIPVEIGAQTATVPAGPGRRSVTVTLGPSETGNITVKLAPTVSTSFRRLRLELGTRASGWTPRDAATELVLCQRYAHRAYLAVLSPVTGQVLCPVSFPQRMRSTPVVQVLAAGVANGATVTTDHVRGPTGTYTTFNITTPNGFWVDRENLYSAEL